MLLIRNLLAMFVLVFLFDGLAHADCETEKLNCDNGCNLANGLAILMAKGKAVDASSCYATCANQQRSCNVREQSSQREQRRSEMLAVRDSARREKERVTSMAKNINLTSSGSLVDARISNEPCLPVSQNLLDQVKKNKLLTPSYISFWMCDGDAGDEFQMQWWVHTHDMGLVAQPGKTDIVLQLVARADPDREPPRTASHQLSDNAFAGTMVPIDQSAPQFQASRDYAISRAQDNLSNLERAWSYVMTGTPDATGHVTVDRGGFRVSVDDPQRALSDWNQDIGFVLRFINHLDPYLQTAREYVVKHLNSTSVNSKMANPTQKNIEVEYTSQAPSASDACKTSRKKCKNNSKEKKLSKGVAKGKEQEAFLEYPADCKKPEWPKSSLRNEEEGTVALTFSVDSDGSVSEIQLTSSSGHRELDKATINALMSCKFPHSSKQSRHSALEYIWYLQ